MRGNALVSDLKHVRRPKQRDGHKRQTGHKRPACGFAIVVYAAGDCLTRDRTVRGPPGHALGLSRGPPWRGELVRW